MEFVVHINTTIAKQLAVFVFSGISCSKLSVWEVEKIQLVAQAHWRNGKPIPNCFPDSLLIFVVMKILIVEDEPELLKAIATSLAKELFVIETATDFYTAGEKMELYDYDCILLDIMLPNGNGLQLLKQLKAAGKAANVIIISAKDALEDKLKGLELGADDYLTKPFHIAELNARVKAVIRRNKLNGKNTVEISNVLLDLNERTFFVNNESIPLNRKEFDVLNYFLLNKNRLVTKTALAEHVWGDNVDQADNFDFIYYQIKNLRKKLQSAGAAIEINALYGIGYKLVEL